MRGWRGAKAASGFQSSRRGPGLRRASVSQFLWLPLRHQVHLHTLHPPGASGAQGFARRAESFLTPGVSGEEGGRPPLDPDPGEEAHEVRPGHRGEGP